MINKYFVKLTIISVAVLQFAGCASSHYNEMPSANKTILTINYKTDLRGASLYKGEHCIKETTPASLTYNLTSKDKV